MEYSKLVAVTGLPGLYELINSKTDGAIVRSLEDKSTKFVASRSHNFSHLESIEVFTTGDNVNLAEIFFAMEKAGDLPDTKDESAVKKYFEKTYPDLDFEKVYASDLKKMVKWFDVLKKNNIEIILPEEPEEEPEEENVPPPPVKNEKKTSKQEVKSAKEEKKDSAKEKPAAKKSTTSEDKKKVAKKEEAAAKEKPKKTAKKTEEKTPKKKK
jgi:Domain of unknown function (DUF5606)